MTWFWIFIAVMNVVSLVERDATKLNRWHDRDESSVIADRIGSVIVIAIAVWALIDRWSLK